MQYNFDIQPDRKDTNCFKHDALKTVFNAGDVTPLWVADMDFEAPDFIKNAVAERAKHPVYGYTFFSDDFYKSVIDWMQNRHNYSMKTSWLNVTPGVVTGISVAIMALTNPDDQIIIQSPVYYPFYDLVKANNRELVINNLCNKSGSYKIDIDDLKSKITDKTKMIIISNPHNPVGRVWTKDELKALVDVCEEHNIMIIADEIHCDITYGNNKYTPIAEINNYARDNSITFIAPSKTFNIAGLSTSICSIPSETIREQFTTLKNRLHFDTGNVFGTVAFEAAYKQGNEWLNQILDYLNKSAEMVSSMFAEHLPEVKVYDLEGTYLMWLDFSALNISDDDLNKLMVEKAKVGLSQGISFGENGTGFMRMNIGSPRTVIEDAVNRIIKAIKE
jgi:cystathionine beta-lyase